jgi:hypothetical protein
MIITKRYAIICIILALLGALVLAFGQHIGFNDVIKAGISGFVFALISSLLVFGYEDAKDMGEQKDKRIQALQAIRAELDLNLQYLGKQLADADLSKTQFAPDKLMKTSFSGISSAGFLSFLTPVQQQFILLIYHKLDRVQMFSDYGVILHASQPEVLHLSRIIILIENDLRESIPPCIQKIDDWLLVLQNDKKGKRG